MLNTFSILSKKVTPVDLHPETAFPSTQWFFARHKPIELLCSDAAAVLLVFFNLTSRQFGICFHSIPAIPISFSLFLSPPWKNTNDFRGLHFCLPTGTVVVFYIYPERVTPSTPSYPRPFDLLGRLITFLFLNLSKAQRTKEIKRYTQGQSSRTVDMTGVVILGNVYGRRGHRNTSANTRTIGLQQIMPVPSLASLHDDAESIIYNSPLWKHWENGQWRVASNGIDRRWKK